MRVSISVTNYSWPGGPDAIAGELAAVARAADAGGLDTLWVADHLLQADPASSLDDPMLEGFVTLGLLAGQTERIRLGTMVAAASFRPPALLIKAVTTLDVLSGGRAWLGVGAGYQEDEARMMGLPLPPVRERLALLEDVLRLAHAMWAGDEQPFEGHDGLRLERPISSPPPRSDPRPGILVGGMGERKTLRYVARYADACNLFDIPDGGATLTRKLAVLARHCEEAGRPLDAIDRTVSTALAPGESPDDAARRFAALGELGIDHVVVITRGAPWTEGTVGTLAAATRLVA